MTATFAAAHPTALPGPVDAPTGVRTPTGADLPRPARGTRAFLIEKGGANGGHLGPDLGVVELTTVAVARGTQHFTLPHPPRTPDP